MMLQNVVSAVGQKVRNKKGHNVCTMMQPRQCIIKPRDIAIKKAIVFAGLKTR